MKIKIERATDVLFIIEKNGGTGSGYSICENPNTRHEIVRSPFSTEQDARIREHEIAYYRGFNAVEIKERPCDCPPNYHTMFEKCRGY